MKKILAFTLMLVLALGLFTGIASAEQEVETVKYYCSIGAYLIKLQEEVDKWNATTGAEVSEPVVLSGGRFAWTVTTIR